MKFDQRPPLGVSLLELPLELELELLGVVLLGVVLPELVLLLDGVVAEPLDVSVLVLGGGAVSELLRVDLLQAVAPKPSASVVSNAAAVSESFFCFMYFPSEGV